MILIGLGSNLDGIYGTPAQCLQECKALFAQAGIYIEKSSSIWTSAPVPVSDQPWYKNSVCIVNTELDPYQLLSALAHIEDKAGRVRDEANAARTLDLDILSYNNEIIGDKKLQLPHTEMYKRAFVLYPLHEVAPNWIHPSLNKSVDEMISDMPAGQEIERC